MTPRRLKLSLLLSAILLAGLVFAGWTQQWFSVELLDGATLAVAGDVAAPALSTLALTCLVLVGALSIAGPFFRVVLGVLQVALGATMVLSGVLALGDPVAASAASISEATGIAGATGVAGLVSSVAMTAWPWISTVASALIAVTGVAVIVTARQWPTSGQKYGRSSLVADGEHNSIDDWDALSDGADPTSR